MLPTMAQAFRNTVTGHESALLQATIGHAAQLCGLILKQIHSILQINCPLQGKVYPLCFLHNVYYAYTASVI